MSSPKVPTVITGGLAVDDRGTVRFINEFDFANIRRFYAVENHTAGFVRAWHGHRHEAKYVLVVSGAALAGAVEIDDWSEPSPNLEVHRFVLAASKPAVLCIPPGYANGFMSLTDGTQVLFFSTATLDQSRDDDIRFPARYWDIWNVEER